MNDFDCNPGCRNGVPIKVNRVFDSCSDKDCFSNLQVNLNGGELPQNVKIVKSRCVTVRDVCLNVEPVPFNRGFFSVDITFTFDIEMLAYEKACSTPYILEGTAFVTKNCILFGSESAVRTFFSDGSPSTGSADSCCCTSVSLPTASVSVVEPIVLETRIEKSCKSYEAEGETQCCRQRNVYVTLGLFSVVELTRPVTVMVPTLDYTVPKRECCSDNDSPCDLFERLKFPTEEFSPVTLTDSDEHGGCGGSCGCKESES
ncbi:MAG: hypothetical protein ACI4JE_03650 [Ruminococcus sp.]